MQLLFFNPLPEYASVQKVQDFAVAIWSIWRDVWIGRTALEKVLTFADKVDLVV